jgi:hypothetical protein
MPEKKNQIMNCQVTNKTFRNFGLQKRLFFANAPADIDIFVMI